MTFDSEDARRAYFTDRLREKLADDEFRATPGFPKGTDDDILALSIRPILRFAQIPFSQIFSTLYQSRDARTIIISKHSLTTYWEVSMVLCTTCARIIQKCRPRR